MFLLITEWVFSYLLQNQVESFRQAGRQGDIQTDRKGFRSTVGYVWSSYRRKSWTVKRQTDRTQEGSVNHRGISWAGERSGQNGTSLKGCIVLRTAGRGLPVTLTWQRPRGEVRILLLLHEAFMMQAKRHIVRVVVFSRCPHCGEKVNIAPPSQNVITQKVL